MNDDQETPRRPIPPPDLPIGAAGGNAPSIPTNPPNIPPVADLNVRIRETATEDESLVEGGTVPFNTRAIAAVIDGVLASGLIMAATWILPGFAEKISWLLGFGYLVTRDSLPFLNGQSVGKTAMKIKVLTLDNKPLVSNWQAAIIRNAVLLIPFFVLVEFYVLLSREEKPERGRRLGDEWAKTKVVVAPAPVKEESPE